MTEIGLLTLKQLLESNKLSVRAFNVCRSLKLKSTKDIEVFVEQGRDFLSARNCGEKTKRELYALYLKSRAEHTESTQSVLFSNKVQVKDLENESRFMHTVEEEYAKLSVRGKNAVLKLFNGSFPSAVVFKKRVIEEPYLTLNIRNAGAKTNAELRIFFRKAIDAYNYCLDNPPTELEIAALNIEKVIGVRLVDNKLLECFVRKEFPLIDFLSKRASDLLGFNNIESYIFKSRLGLLDEHYDLSYIASKFNLSKERVRQISNKVFDSAPRLIKERFEAAHEYTVYIKSIHGEPIIDLSTFTWPIIIHKEIQSYGTVFSSYILGNLFPDSFYPLTRLDKLKRPVEVTNYQIYNPIKSIKGSYLINSRIIPKELLINVLNFCLAEKCKSHAKDKVISFSKLLNEVPDGNFLTALSILSYILKKELQIEVVDSSIKFSKNRQKLIYEYAVEALENLKRPSHITDIFREVKRIYPDFDSPQDSLKNTITRTKDVFIFFGRSSTYALKKWEKSNSYIKGGTIRDIVEEFLKGFNEPCHISAITKYVNNYRRTSESSVMTNLKMTVENRFEFYDRGYVGLKRAKNIKRNNSPKQSTAEIPLDELLENIFKR